jgi:tetratricopeptide (TPR) repeat protein
LFAQGRSADARLHAERALALAERDPALHPKSLVLSAQILRRLGQNETAIRMLDQAERELGGGDGPSAAGVRAKALRAAIHADRNDFDRALPLYAAAIDEAQAAEGPQSLVAIDIRLNVARNLVTLERVDESRPYRESALAALRAGGGPGKLRAALEESGSAAEMFEMAQIPFAQARDAIERNRASVAAQGELVPESIRAAIDFALGTILLDWGNISAAEPLLSGNVVALRARSEGLGERLELAGIQGSLAMVAGHHDEADALFRERLDLRQRSGRAQHPYAAYDYAFIAVNLVMQGRLEAAHGVLRTAPLIAAVAGSSGAPLAYRATLQSALARVELERGDAAAALALLPPADQDEDTLFPFDASLLRGEILCAVGRRAEGLKWLDKSLALHGAREYDGNPALARARAVTGLCALSAGDRTRARELARQAHHAFLLQPAVSNYFKAPLGQLERTLGESRPG